METVPKIVVRLETESGACLRRVKVSGFADIRAVAEALQAELIRVKALAAGNPTWYAAHPERRTG